MAIYETPEQFVGKSLKQIQKETGAAFRSDVLSSFLGINENTPLQQGQSFNANFDPGSGEYAFLSSSFAPAGTYSSAQSANLAAKQKVEEDAFMTALNTKVAGQESLTSAAGRIGGELNLPSLRQSAFDLTQTLQDVTGAYRDITPEQQVKAKQVGISAPNLSARIRAKQEEYQPTVESVSRAAQQGVSAQQFAEGQLTTQLGYLLQDQAKELEPFYQAQLPLLSDRLAREQSNYTQDKQNELTLLLTQMSQNFTATQAELDRAQQLSMTEMQYNQVKNSQSIETIGGRKVLVTYDNNGNIVARIDLGSSTSGTSGGKPTLEELAA